MLYSPYFTPLIQSPAETLDEFDKQEQNRKKNVYVNVNK